MHRGRARRGDAALLGVIFIGTCFGSGLVVEGFPSGVGGSDGEGRLRLDAGCEQEWVWIGRGRVGERVASAPVESVEVAVAGRDVNILGAILERVKLVAQLGLDVHVGRVSGPWRESGAGVEDGGRGVDGVPRHGNIGDMGGGVDDGQGGIFC